MEKEKIVKRYLPLKKHPGIRKDVLTEKYQAYKTIDGKRYSMNFKTLNEAIEWRNTFHPRLRLVSDQQKNETISAPDVELNGTKKEFTLFQVWEMYQKFHFPQLERSSVEVKLERAKFFQALFEIKMVHLSPEVIDTHLEKQKMIAIKFGTSRRNSFRAELCELRALLNWYRENVDFKFVCPVLKRHKQLGIIKKAEIRNKKMSPEETLLFFGSLTPFFRDFAQVQFFIAGRVQEVAGIQVLSVDFKNRSLLIKDVVVWNKKKHFVELKPQTKNGDIRYCYLNDVLLEIFQRRLNEIPKGCSYVFHLNGEPLGYRRIQHEYNKALKKCGLYGKFSSTHIMRHSMATITRLVTGSLEATQAVTGHKDQKLVQHYASLPSLAQTDAVKSVESFMKDLEASMCSKVFKK